MNKQGNFISLKKALFFLILAISIASIVQCKSHINYVKKDALGSLPLSGSRVFIIPEIQSEPKESRENFSANFYNLLILTLKRKGYTVVDIKKPVTIHESIKKESANEFQWFFKSGNYETNRKTYSYTWDQADYSLKITILDYRKGFSIDSDYIELALSIYDNEDKSLCYFIRYVGFYDNISEEIKQNALK